MNRYSIKTETGQSRTIDDDYDYQQGRIPGKKKSLRMGAGERPIILS